LSGSLELFLSVLLDITYTKAVVKAATTRKQIKNGQIYGFLALLCLLRTPVLVCTLQQQIHRL
jgi:hypothetical protein